MASRSPGACAGRPASPWLGGRHSFAGACCPDRGLADGRRASAGLLQPDAADDKRTGWSVGNRPVGNDRGPAAGGQLPDRDRRGSDCRPHARAHAADPDGPFYSRRRRHSGTGHGPDVAPPRLRGKLRRYDSGLARTCRQARAGAIVDPQCLRLRDGDRDLRRIVLLAPDRSTRGRRRPGHGRAADVGRSGPVSACCRARLAADARSSPRSAIGWLISWLSTAGLRLLLCQHLLAFREGAGGSRAPR
jgi:hypothetical protein